VILAFTNNTDTITRAPSYLGSTSNEVLTSLWQFEAGSFPTSYIPTTTAPLARSADVCSITGSDFSGFYNPVEGSFATSQIFNAPTSYPTAAQVVFDVNDTTSLNRTRILRFSNSGYASYLNTVGGTTDVQISGSTAIATGVVNKFAGCMKANDFTIYLNSVSQGVDTVATMQSAPTTFTIGDISSGVATRAPIHGTIASIRYYRKRLSNEKLQALTQLVSDVDANAYIVSLLSAGATVTPTQQAAINNFYKTGKSDGWYSSLKRLYLPIWAAAAPNAIDMIALGSGTFSGSVTHGSGFVQSDGTTGYFDFVTPQSEIGESANATHRGFLSLTGPSSITTVHMGAQGPTGAETYQIGSISGTTIVSQHGSIQANATLSAANQTGIFIASKTSDLAILFRRNTSGSSVIASTSGVNVNNLSNRRFYAMARNSVGVANLFSTAQYGSWFCGTGLNESQSISFSLNLKNLWETCTGLTLP
jgi:hypothetical protein